MKPLSPESPAVLLHWDSLCCHRLKRCLGWDRGQPCNSYSLKDCPERSPQPSAVMLSRPCIAHCSSRSQPRTHQRISSRRIATVTTIFSSIQRPARIPKQYIAVFTFLRTMAGSSSGWVMHRRMLAMVPDVPAAKHTLPSIVGMQSPSFPSAPFSESHLSSTMSARVLGYALFSIGLHSDALHSQERSTYLLKQF